MTARRSREDRWFDGINVLLMLLIVAAALYPFYFILIQSFNEGKDASLGGIYLWPRAFTTDNYTAFFMDAKWTDALLVSVARLLAGSVFSVLVTCLAAYGLAYRGLLFKRLYIGLVVVSMYFSGGLITYYILLRSLGLLDTFFVYVIPGALNGFFLLIAISFFKEIPEELKESAAMDGAGDWTVFVRIVLPVSMPLVATMLLFVGVNQWNAWVDSAYFVRSESLRTISFRMMEVINQANVSVGGQAANYAAGSRVTPLSLQMTAMVIATLPIMCVYPFLQKYFVNGVMIGAVKG
ncbi:carbohydrate ABC transporter permease [Cohnella sp. GCM10020058]|uniref:carbohydrate ABC transporter permease n=1 Tax=Cohnella sp. GCM10020058 TaxID=3317330 RepID=UPI00362CA86E